MGVKCKSDNMMTAEEMQKHTENILAHMDKTISDRTFRQTMSKVKKESVLKMKKYEEKLVIIEERGSYSKTDKDTTFMRMKEEALNNDQTSLYTMFRLQQRIRSLRTTTYTEKLLI